MNEQIKPLFDLLAGHCKFLPGLVLWIGALKIFFHFIGPVVQSYLAGIIANIAKSSDQDDDHFLVKMLGCKPYRVIAFILRLASLPVPTLADYYKAKATQSNVASGAAAAILAFCLLSFVAFGIFVSGCKTGPPGSAIITVNTNGLVSIGTWTVNTNDVVTGIRIAATLGTQAAIHYDTNATAYLEAVEVILTAALNDKQYDPAVIQASLSTISIKEAHDQEIINDVNEGLQLYQAFFGHVVSEKIDNANVYLAPALTGLRDGIAVALPFTSLALESLTNIPVVIQPTNSQ